MKTHRVVDDYLTGAVGLGEDCESEICQLCRMFFPTKHVKSSKLTLDVEKGYEHSQHDKGTPTTTEISRRLSEEAREQRQSPDWLLRWQLTRACYDVGDDETDSNDTSDCSAEAMSIRPSFASAE